MTPLEQVATIVGIAVAGISVAKAGFAVARFFADLAANLRALTEAVKALTQRLDDHRSEFATLRERVASLESWREDFQ